MNEFRNRAFIVAALTLSAALVFAQGGGGGQGGGRGQGRGGFGQGGFGGGFGGGMASEIQLAGRPDVQADIKATDDQKKKLQEYQDKQREARRAAGGAGAGAGGAGGRRGGGAGGGGGFGGGGNFDPAQLAAMRERQAQQRAEMLKAIGEIFTADQVKRLGEIRVQLAGNRAILDAEVQKSLGMTEAQIKQITDLQTKQREANRAVMEKMRNQEISREEAQAAFEKNNKALDEEFGKILTKEQADKLKAMGGAPFKADNPSGGGR